MTSFSDVERRKMHGLTYIFMIVVIASTSPSARGKQSKRSVHFAKAICAVCSPPQQNS